MQYRFFIPSQPLFSTMLFVFTDRNIFVLPYLPFFSACNGFDSHIPISWLLEGAASDQCTFVPPDQTVPVSDYEAFSFGTSDSCDISIECAYEEDLANLQSKFR